MTRTIKASEVKPGMEVQFDLSGWDVKGTVATVDVSPHAVWIYTEERCEMSLDLDTPVTVLAEPQPAEPTAFGARVVVNRRRFTRAQQCRGDLRPWISAREGTWFTWDEVLGLGQVTVIDADPPWTLPAQVKVAPEVPERIEEWPEDDEALRKHKWRDVDGGTWTWAKAEDKWECRSRADIRMGASRRPGSWFGPFIRVTDA